MVERTNLKKAYLDLENTESQFEKSHLDWLSVRPVTLIDKEQTNRVQIINRYGIFSKISRYDVAKWMLDALEREGKFRLHYEMIGWA